MDSPGDNTYQQWASVIECPICYTVYNKPMQMSCGHTICSTCIGRLTGGKTSGPTEIRCPECRKPTKIPVDGLPVNYRIQEIVQKVAPLFKYRQLESHCTQCKEILPQGVYFDCSQCEETGVKICPTCAIRLHNGHVLVEKKALTPDDVRVLKEKINEASARASEAIENIKPQFESVGGSIEKKVIDNLESFKKIFDFLLNSIDSKIKDTSTMDELMVEVEKAERVAETYEKGRKTEQLMAVIEKAVEEYLKPFEKLKQEMDFQPESPDIAAAPAPAPAPVAQAPLLPPLPPVAPLPPPFNPNEMPNARRNIYRDLNQSMPGHPQIRTQVGYPAYTGFPPRVMNPPVGFGPRSHAHQQFDRPGPAVHEMIQQGPLAPQAPQFVPQFVQPAPQNVPHTQHLPLQQFQQQQQAPPHQMLHHTKAPPPQMPQPREMSPNEPSTSSGTSVTQLSTSNSKKMKMEEPEAMDS